MGSSYYFWPTKIFICLYHEEQCQIGNAKTFDLNLLTKFWKTLLSSQIFERQIPKYIKLVEFAMCKLLV
jgi:hypothetical protein